MITYKTHHTLRVFFPIVAFLVLALVLLYMAVLFMDPFRGLLSLLLFLAAYYFSGFPKEISLSEKNMEITETLRRKKISVPYSDIEWVSASDRQQAIKPATVILIGLKSSDKPIQLIFSIYEKGVGYDIIKALEKRLGKGKIREKPEWMVSGASG